jgi:hypothetical protein
MFFDNEMVSGADTKIILGLPLTVEVSTALAVK